MKTILIIDDDVNIGNMLEEILKKEGFGVLRAYSGTEALLLLSQIRPDLILLDLMLPGLNGEELLPQIKEIPVIVVSAKVGIDEKVELLTGGAVGYVPKPFYTREVVARNRVHFRGKVFRFCGGLFFAERSVFFFHGPPPSRLIPMEIWGFSAVKLQTQQQGKIPAAIGCPVSAALCRNPACAPAESWYNGGTTNEREGTRHAI